MDNNYNNIITIKFAQAERPVFKEKAGKDYVNFGLKNDYPKYLLDLYNESPKHGAIIKSKVKYIFGNGFEGIDQPANSSGESWNKLVKKCILDDEIFDGYYLQIIYNLKGEIKDVFHIEYFKVRTNKAHSKFYVKDDWNNAQEKERCYDAYNSTNPQGSQILFIRQYNPSGDAYPIPNYYQALNYIESDVHVSRHILGIAKDSFVGSTLINLNGGEPQEEQKASVESGLKKKFHGSEGDRTVIMFNKSRENAAEILPLSQTLLTKEDFTNINNLIQQEIFSGHSITSPTLMGIATAGALGQRNEIQDAYEIFNNTYVNERQQAHEETFGKIFNLVGITGEHKIVPVKPLGFNLKEELLLEVLPREYFLDELNVDPKYFSLPPVKTTTNNQQQQPVDVNNPQQPVNANLAGMTGRQFQQLERIKRKFEAGKLTREQAAMMLKSSFGLTDDDVSLFLDANTEEFDTDNFAEHFNSCGENISDYEILSVKELNEKQYFADVKKLSDIEQNIYDLLKEKLTVAEIADKLKVDAPVIEKAIAVMVKGGVLSEALIPTNKKPASQVKIQIMYSYGWRPEVPVTERDTAAHPSRDFCKELMRLAISKLWSRSDIEKISARLGYSVFDRAGGWWTMPDGTHSPQCRHQWNVLTVVKKNK
jgi:hypothetical protein